MEHKEEYKEQSSVKVNFSTFKYRSKERVIDSDYDDYDDYELNICLNDDRPLNTVQSPPASQHDLPPARESSTSSIVNSDPRVANFGVPEVSNTPYLDNTKIDIIDRSTNEILRHVETIKENCPNKYMDLVDARSLLMRIMRILLTPEDFSTMEWFISQLRTIPEPVEAVPPIDISVIDPALLYDAPSPSNNMIAGLDLAFVRSLAPDDFVATSPQLPKAEDTKPELATPKVVELEDKSTQTEPAPPKTTNELWRQELASIRRLRPLFPGKYTVVNLPLRGTSKSNSGLDPKIPDAVVIIDTDNESDEAPIPTRSSNRVGGGDKTSYPGNEANYMNSDLEKHARWSSQHNSQIFMGQHLVEIPGDDSETEECDGGVYHRSSHTTGKSPGITLIRHKQGRSLEYEENIRTDTRSERLSRSRSPVPRQDRLTDQRSYREKRGTCRKYEGMFQPHDETPCNRAAQRYIRDEPEHHRFYGLGEPGKHTNGMLRYQDLLNAVGEVPGPRSGLRLKLSSYVHDVSGGVVRDLDLGSGIKRVVEETFYSGETLDEEQSMRHNWTKDKVALYKGFPLVETVGFVAAHNDFKPSGDCYWRALAYSLHGTPARWDIVKADHQAYLRHVLSDMTHPRHKLYTKLNTQFFETSGPTTRSEAKFKANIWQMLHLPHSWTPGVMQQVTADLYNIYLVTFTYDKWENKCTEVAIRGTYNSRHIFMLYVNNCHFQPLAVNEYLG